MNKPLTKTRRQDPIRCLSLDGMPLNTKFGWLNKIKVLPSGMATRRTGLQRGRTG